MPQPRSSTSRPAQAATRGHRRHDPPVGVDGAVLDLVRRGVVPDVGARAVPGRAACRRPVRSGRGRAGVCTCAAMMPGVPLGATQSTFTSSSGASTVSPSHSLTRCGSPAISRQAREKSPSAPALGCSSAGHLPLDEERQLRVGDQAVDADLLPAQLGAVGAVPVAVDGLAAEPLLDRGDVVDRDDPAEPAAAERRSGRARPGRTAPCRRPGGRAPRRSRGRCRRPAAGSCCGCRSAGGRHRRGTRCRAAPPMRWAVLGEAVGSGGEREMVQAHAEHCERALAPRRQRGRCLLTSRRDRVRVVGVSAGRRGGSPSADRDRRCASQCRDQLVVRRLRPSARSAPASLVT